MTVWSTVSWQMKRFLFFSVLRNDLQFSLSPSKLSDQLFNIFLQQKICFQYIYPLICFPSGEIDYLLYKKDENFKTVSHWIMNFKKVRSLWCKQTFKNLFKISLSFHIPFPICRSISKRGVALPKTSITGLNRSSPPLPPTLSFVSPPPWLS